MIIYYITHHVKIYGAGFLYSQFHIGMPYILLCTSIYGPQVSITSPPYVLITFKNRKIMQMPTTFYYKLQELSPHSSVHLEDVG